MTDEELDEFLDELPAAKRRAIMDHLWPERKAFRRLLLAVLLVVTVAIVALARAIVVLYRAIERKLC